MASWDCLKISKGMTASELIGELAHLPDGVDIGLFEYIAGSGITIVGDVLRIPVRVSEQGRVTQTSNRMLRLPFGI